MAKNNFVGIIDKIEKQSQKQSIKHGSRLIFGTVITVSPLSIQINQDDKPGEILTAEYFEIGGHISLEPVYHYATFTGVLTGEITGHLKKDGTITGYVTHAGVISGNMSSSGNIETEAAINGEVSVNGITEITDIKNIDTIAKDINWQDVLDSHAKMEIEGDLSIEGDVKTDGSYKINGDINAEVSHTGNIDGNVTTDGEITGNVEITGIFEGYLHSETLNPVLRIGDIVLLTSYSNNQKFLIEKIIGRTTQAVLL